MDRVLAQMIGELDWRLVALAGVVCTLACAFAFIAIFRRRVAACATPSVNRNILEDLSKEKLREQNICLDAALNNMSQGVCMLDANARIVVFNRRFLDMYSLSPQVVKADCTLRQLIEHRIEVGLLDTADAEQYCRNILDNVAKGSATSHIIRTTDGRQILACNQPMPGGGWVTTHEDITERRKTEDRVNEQTIQLDTALNNMSQGLIMFDAEDRKSTRLNSSHVSESRMPSSA